MFIYRITASAAASLAIAEVADKTGSSIKKSDGAVRTAAGGRDESEKIPLAEVQL